MSEEEDIIRRLLPPYTMTGCTGSLRYLDVFKHAWSTWYDRYMAPEVAQRRAYDETCDVYSLSVILWELMTLERPFKGLDKGERRDQFNMFID